MEDDLYSVILVVCTLPAFSTWLGQMCLFNFVLLIVGKFNQFCERFKKTEILTLVS